MKNSKNLKLIFELLIPLSLSLLIFILSKNQGNWFSFWHSLSIPAQIPFSDLKAHIHFYDCFKNEINIYLNECYLIPDGNAKISTHPKIWIHLVDFLNLQKEYIYNIFIITVYTIYFFSLIKLFLEFKEIKSRIFFSIFFISTTNLILIERFSTDIFIFIIVFLVLNIKRNYLKSLLILFGVSLKYYPIFLLSIFISNKKYLLLNCLFFFLFISIFYFDQIKLVSENILEVALLIAYGARTLAKAFYHLSTEYDFFITDRNYHYFKNFIILLTSLYCLVIFITGYLFSKIKINNISNNFDAYFISGASIYIGTFIIGSNFDYRLIFLILTIPYIININNFYLKFLLITSITISINSFLFQHSEYLFLSEINHWIYYTKAAFVYLCKFLILSFLCFLLGSNLKKINFLSLNDKK